MASAIGLPAELGGRDDRIAPLRSRRDAEQRDALAVNLERQRFAALDLDEHHDRRDVRAVVVQPALSVDERSRDE
jgi:hypothetical protein